ncbi:MAG: hypothetical protein ACHQNT_02960 [Bacteroidia bacterium]
MKFSNSETKQIQKLSFKQKISLRVVWIVSSAIIFAIILLIYINLQKTEEIKANTDMAISEIEIPTDMVVLNKTGLQDTVGTIRGANFIIAKPLNTPAQVQH